MGNTGAKPKIFTGWEKERQANCCRAKKRPIDVDAARRCSLLSKSVPSPWWSEHLLCSRCWLVWDSSDPSSGWWCPLKVLWQFPEESVSSYEAWLSAFVDWLSACVTPSLQFRLRCSSWPFLNFCVLEQSFFSPSLPQAHRWVHCSGGWSDCHILNRTEEHFFLESQHQVNH